MRSILITALVVLSIAAGAQQPLSLTEGMKLAKQLSPKLKEARAEYLAAQAESRNMLSMTGIQVGINGFAARSEPGAILSSPTGADPNSSMLVPSGKFWSASFMAMLPLFVPDLRLQSSSANWRMKAAAGRLAEEENELSLMVTEAFSMAIMAGAEKAAASANLEAMQEVLRTNIALFEAGKTYEAQVLRVRSELKRAERSATRANSAAEKAVLELKETIGLPMTQDVTLSEAPFESIQAPRVDEAVSTSKARRGLLVAARAEFEAAAKNLQAARSRSLPRIYATGMYDTTSEREMNGGTLGVTLSLPIFTSGRIRSEIDEATAMLGIARSRLAAAELQVEREVRSAILDLQTAQAGVESARAELEAATSVNETIRLRVEVGKSILLEQLDALSSLAMARSDLIEANYELVRAKARLVWAIGGAI